MSGTGSSHPTDDFEAAVDAATVADVPGVLIERAIELRYQSAAAVDLLTSLTCLRRRERSTNLAESIVPFLKTDEERAAVLRLVSRAIAETRSVADVDELAMLRFAVERRSPLDDEVRAFVFDGMQRATSSTSKQSRQKKFNVRDARSALLGLKAVFDEHGKRFFLDRGTLLGAVRERGFIANDYDIDLGIFGDEVGLDEIKKMFEPTAFTLNQDFDYKVGLLSPSGIQIDFFLTTRERGYFLSKGFRSIHNWYFSPFELMEFEFLGATFLIPDSYEKHLHENYGNWRNPALFYDLSYNEPCVSYGQHAYSVNYLARRMAVGLRDNDRYFSESPARRLRDQFGIDYADWFPSGGTARVVPKLPSRVSRRPIFIVDLFSQYTHRLRRLLESALGLTDDVRVLVVEAPASETPLAALGDRLTVARAIDRVASVNSMAAVTSAAIGSLVDQGAAAVVLPSDEARRLDAQVVQWARERGCTIAVFGDDSVALTLDDSKPVVVRSVRGPQRSKPRPSRTEGIPNV
jgi:hypothetical protein